MNAPIQTAQQLHDALLTIDTFAGSALGDADQLGRHHEILLTKGQEPAADHAGQLGPTDQGDDDGNGEIHPHDVPIIGQGRRQAWGG